MPKAASAAESLPLELWNMQHRKKLIHNKVFAFPQLPQDFALLTSLSLSLSSATRSFKQLQARIYFIDMKTSHRQNFYTLLFP
jgi:hypothetical protein